MHHFTIMQRWTFNASIAECSNWLKYMILYILKSIKNISILLIEHDTIYSICFIYLLFIQKSLSLCFSTHPSLNSIMFLEMILNSSKKNKQLLEFVNYQSPQYTPWFEGDQCTMLHYFGMRLGSFTTFISSTTLQPC